MSLYERYVDDLQTMIGSKLSHYKITAELGRGGMGIVYRATDTKLNRDVAIKVLPAAALASEDDRARFYREAKAAAALNHPNIASIYQIDEAVAEGAPANEPSPFIAMEFIDGETLEARIKAGPMKLDEVIRIATEVASGLKAAHGKEIVHRDIKSANIMLDGENRAKILDFGLAQTAQSTKLTRMGSTLGTMAYMSPEQARGDEVDARTDLWALGVVIYEMISGTLPFASDYEQAAVYSILNEEAEPLTSLRTGVPMALEQIVDKCLTKDRELRYRTADDVIIDLQRVVTGLSSPAMSSVRPSSVSSEPAVATKSATKSSAKRPLGVYLSVAGLVALVVGATMMMMSFDKVPVRKFERYTQIVKGIVNISSLALSPDERYAAITGADTLGNNGIFLFDRSADSWEYIQGSSGGFYPLFSPSGNRMTFTSNRDIYIVDIPSGVPRVLVSPGYTGYWIDEDTIFYTEVGNDAQSSLRGLKTYSISTNEEATLVASTILETDRTYIYPGPIVPGTDYLVANEQYAGNVDSEPRLLIVDLQSGDVRFGERGIINPQAIARDILLYQYRDDRGPLVARRFDPQSGEFLSAPVSVADPMFFALFHAGPEGTLIFSREAAEAGSKLDQLFWVNTSETKLSTLALPYSADRHTVDIFLDSGGDNALLAAYSARTDEVHIYRANMATGDISRLTSDKWIRPVSFSAEGDFYAVYRRGNAGDYRYVLGRQAVSGSAAVDTVSIEFRSIRSAFETTKGVLMQATTMDDERVDGYLNESRTLDPISFQLDDGLLLDVSPDGRNVAVLTDTGVDDRISVVDIETGNTSNLFETGKAARWSPDGQYLYFIQDTMLRRVEVSRASGGLTFSESEFVLRRRFGFNKGISYNVGADGKVIVVAAGISLDESVRTYSTIEWWRNYDVELDRLLANE